MQIVETAYAYSRLINTLINTDIKLHREFVRQINWTSIQDTLIKESKPNLYSWGELYNRLVYSLPKKEYLSVGKMLENAIEKFSDTVLNIEDLTCFLCSVMHINSDYIHKTVEKIDSYICHILQKKTCRRQFIYLTFISWDMYVV